jgi:hypothetical protein
MRFLLRTVFWLGLTFHAMPWGDARWSDALPDARAALGAALATQAPDATAPERIAGALLRASFDPQSATPAARPPAARASVDTLTQADRLAPWRGPGLRGAL